MKTKIKKDVAAAKTANPRATTVFPPTAPVEVAAGKAARQTKRTRRPGVMAIAADGSTKPWDELTEAQVHVVLEPALPPKHFSNEAILQAVQAALRW